MTRSYVPVQLIDSAACDATAVGQALTDCFHESTDLTVLKQC